MASMDSGSRRTALAAFAGAAAGAAAATALLAAVRAARRRSGKARAAAVVASTSPPRSSSGTAKAAGGRAAQLRELMAQGRLIVMPCAYDALTARLIERAGFELTFMTGFGVSASRGYPDCQLVSYQEMIESAFAICSSLRNIPCIGDGDTGYGNAVNVKRTVRGYAQAGLAGVMIEDQVAPKRCGHTKGKAVISREEAIARVRAACDARDESPVDICIMARTDARTTHGLDEAIARCLAFREAGADITFLEAPESIAEMERYCREVPGPKLANMVEGGKTPILPQRQLEKLGYTIVAYPVTLLSAGIKAQMEVLGRIREGVDHSQSLLSWSELRETVGFEEYYAEDERYHT
eukprot:TRINITY_DN22871_c0_g1_i1.p1 TRINITY_DN22871_c0_g1~~TRINITY_DN22871_c0_g1_i1.p1  ORF type:complete len:378 (-),score=58.79 TRINITY_DN22871_c0_g1_i1:96-1151(-)